MTNREVTEDRSTLLLSLWTEVGRHLGLEASLAVLAEACCEAMGAGTLRLDELLGDGSDLVTIAEWDRRTGPRIRRRARGLGAAAIVRLREWAAHDEIAARGAGPGDGIPKLLGFKDDGHPGLLAPLRVEGEWLGVLAVSGSRGRSFEHRQRVLMRAALEPFAAAIRNDRRLRDIQHLTAAAEADRHSLLSRLGRASLNESVVGADAGLRGVMARVDSVANTDATVLILGETGAGKEVVARAIHERSERREGPFVRVNCGAVAPELIDSELFGHEKGSFTGALAVRRGWFERADGGTLFLDEIGELTPPVQVRLLRVLQDNIVQRVGGEREIAVNLRIIAATHRDLPTLVQEGRFREDLWYRLAVFPIILPPLRERLSDIPALAGHFVQRAANRLGLPVPPMTPRDLDSLGRYRWPGNVRELSAVLERAVILGQGKRLDLDTALGPAVAVRAGQDTVASPVASRSVASSAAAIASADLSLDAALTAHLRQVLELTHGRIDGPHGAARHLAVNPSTLRAKLRKLGIDARAVRSAARHV